MSMNLTSYKRKKLVRMYEEKLGSKLNEFQAGYGRPYDLRWYWVKVNNKMKLVDIETGEVMDVTSLGSQKLLGNSGKLWQLMVNKDRTPGQDDAGFCNDANLYTRKFIMNSDKKLLDIDNVMEQHGIKKDSGYEVRVRDVKDHPELSVIYIYYQDDKSTNVVYLYNNEKEDIVKDLGVVKGYIRPLWAQGINERYDFEIDGNNIIIDSYFPFEECDWNSLDYKHNVIAM